MGPFANRETGLAPRSPPREEEAKKEKDQGERPVRREKPPKTAKSERNVDCRSSSAYDSGRDMLASLLEGGVRYRTAAAVTLGMIVLMFGVPAAVEAFLLPRLVDPIPFYEQMILEVTVFFLTWRFFLVPPAIVLPFVVATFTGDPRARK